MTTWRIIGLLIVLLIVILITALSVCDSLQSIRRCLDNIHEIETNIEENTKSTESHAEVISNTLFDLEDMLKKIDDH